MLEVDTTCDSHIVKRRKLRDISKLVRKGENGTKLMFEKQSLEVFGRSKKKELISKREIKKLKEKEEVAVRSESWEIVLINRIAENDVIRKNMIESIEQNREIDSLFFYTDGSLGTSEREEELVMGCGIVQITETRHLLRQLSCATKKWFSSTRAELVAILFALLITPTKRKIEIRTDSKAAILAIKRGLEINKIRHWLKVKNVSLVATIVEVIKTKELNVFFTKIKGHSGDIFNDLADLKAKEGAKSTEHFIPRTICTKKHKYKYIWEGELVEKPICSFIKLLGKVLIKAEWTFLHNTYNETH